MFWYAFMQEAESGLSSPGRKVREVIRSEQQGPKYCNPRGVTCCAVNLKFESSRTELDQNLISIWN
jgi:hypothetical protein